MAARSARACCVGSTVAPAAVSCRYVWQVSGPAHSSAGRRRWRRRAGTCSGSAASSKTPAGRCSPRGRSCRYVGPGRASSRAGTSRGCAQILCAVSCRGDPPGPVAAAPRAMRASRRAGSPCSQDHHCRAAQLELGTEASVSIVQEKTCPGMRMSSSARWSYADVACGGVMNIERNVVHPCRRAGT